MRGINSLVMLTMFLSLLTVFFAALAPHLTVEALSIGVSPGQYFTYGTSSGDPWVNVNPSSTLPPPSMWETYENFSTINLTITSVGYASDYTITSNETIKFRNGTIFGPFASDFDVYSGFGGGIFFIRPELDAGMRIYPENPNSTYTINSTQIDQGYWSGRKVCLLNITTVNPLVNMSSVMAARRTIIYYDYTTGVLLSAFEEAGMLDPTTQQYLEGYLLFQLIDNNVGIPMNYPLKSPPTIKVFTDTSSTSIGFYVNVSGQLLNSQLQGMSNETVVLYYLIPGTTSWALITSSKTSADGSFSAMWTPSATGTFILKAEWHSNSTSQSVSCNATLAVMPLRGKYIFSLESNSTITGLVYNSASNTITFSASGLNGTHGYVKITLAKTLIRQVSDLKVYIDSHLVNYTTIEVGESYVFYFVYSHSTHQITILGFTPAEGRIDYAIPLLIMVALAVLSGAVGYSILGYSVLRTGRKSPKPHGGVHPKRVLNIA